MKRSTIIKAVIIAAYLLFVTVSLVKGFEPGKQVAENFYSFSRDMMSILPCAFILIGLFEVWVKRETIEKHFGEESGFKGYIWALLLASTTFGILIALPVSCSLFNKGAKLSIIFTYISAAAICRIPMAVFEASFLGIKFTAIRLCVSLPLIIVTSVILGNYLTEQKYEIIEGK